MRKVTGDRERHAVSPAPSPAAISPVDTVSASLLPCCQADSSLDTVLSCGLCAPVSTASAGRPRTRQAVPLGGSSHASGFYTQKRVSDQTQRVSDSANLPTFAPPSGTAVSSEGRP